MDDIDKRIKTLCNKIKSPLSDLTCSLNLSDDSLSRYIDGILDENDKKRIELHLLDCNYCLNLILIHQKTRDEKEYAQFSDVPLSWKAKAKNLYSAQDNKCKRGIFDLILSLTKETIEVISNPGSLEITYGAVPMPVRSVNKIMSPNLIILNKTFSDMESAVEVERVDDSHVNMRIRTIDTRSGEPSKVLRVSLLNPDRELASYVTKSGEVYFANLSYGEYQIKIIRDREEIGNISLNITLCIN